MVVHHHLDHYQIDLHTGAFFDPASASYCLSVFYLSPHRTGLCPSAANAHRLQDALSKYRHLDQLIDHGH